MGNSRVLDKPKRCRNSQDRTEFLRQPREDDVPADLGTRPQNLRCNDNDLNGVGQWLDAEADILNSEGEDLSFWSVVARLDTQLVRHLLSGKLDQDSRSTLRRKLDALSNSVCFFTFEGA